MEQYLTLCRHVLAQGEKRIDRTGTGTISIFGYQLRFNLQEGFPLLTTKKVHFHSVMGELLWFLTGSTSIRPLVQNNIRIWNDWPYAKYKKSTDYQGETMETFIEKIKTDELFAMKWGDLGPVYGKQWRDFAGFDQLLNLQEEIRHNPHSRRLIMSAWNPPQIKNMALPPCHAFMQFYVSADGKRLSCQLYQRSADVFLGLPFNIASYALLTHLLAHSCHLEVGELVISLGDTHIYLNHIDQINEQLKRSPLPLSKLVIKRSVDSIVDFKPSDIELVNYLSHPPIKGAVSV